MTAITLYFLGAHILYVSMREQDWEEDEREKQSTSAFLMLLLWPVVALVSICIDVKDFIKKVGKKS